MDNELSYAVQSTRMERPQPASLCSVEILKYVRTFDGEDKVSGRGTGFHYRDTDGNVWLVTNWHVLTGRRPDDPSFIVGAAPISPDSIGVAYQTRHTGHFLPHLRLPLYNEDGQPAWYEFEREKGVDLAAIPVNLPEDALCPCVQDFAERDSGALVPGLDLVIVGMAFPHEIGTPYPIWKSARVASEPRFMIMGVPQVLVDSAGVPGMSGAPVYRITKGVRLPLPEGKAAAESLRGGGALDLLGSLDLSKIEEVPMLSFVGVYAGSTGHRDLDKLSLGRMFIASIIDLLVQKKIRGVNPYPPDLTPSATS